MKEKKKKRKTQSNKKEMKSQLEDIHSLLLKASEEYDWRKPPKKPL